MGVRRWRTTALIGATALIATAALAGCGADSSDNTTSGAVAPAAGVPGVGEADRAPEQATNQGATDQPARAPDLSVDQRSIVYTGSITVRVDNVDQKAAQAGAVAAGAGGFVSGDKRSSGTGADSDATLELRIPAAKFTSVVDELAGLGSPEQRSINTEDVTEQVIDLDARIATQQARVNSGRTLLARAKDLEDLVMLEREVATREADLASLTAKKRRLADLTALSTITVVLLGPQAKAAGKDDDPAGFIGGLKGGWKALVASLAVLLTILGALLPWLIALGVPAAAAFWLVRRFGRRSPRPLFNTGVPAPAFATPGAQSQPTTQAPPGPAADATPPEGPSPRST
jgi:hypothetical protein